VLDPDVVLRADQADGLSVVRGAARVASGALTVGRLAPLAQPVLVNGAAGIIATEDGELLSVLAFTVADGRIVEIDIVGDPARLHRLGMVPGR
jgi:hypothetical protein